MIRSNSAHFVELRAGFGRTIAFRKPRAVLLCVGLMVLAFRASVQPVVLSRAH